MEHQKHAFAILEAVPDLIFIMDRNGKYLDFRGGKGVVFIPPQQMIGTYIQDSQIPKIIVQQIIEHIQKAIDFDQLNLLEYAIEFPEGLRYYESRATKYDENIALRIVRETTQEVLNQKKMQKLNEEIILQNQRLIQYNHIVSHHLRGPVATILGDNLVNAIKSQAKKLDNTIQDLNEILSHSHLIEENKSELDMAQELLLIMGIFQEQIKKTNATISFDFSKCGMFYTVRSFLQSVLEHLFSNALKFKDPKRKLHIHLETFIEEKNKVKMQCFSIKDTGLGINLKRYKDDIFNLYKKFHADIAGKGISLYLIKTLLEMLEGEISVESTENEGAIFLVKIPV